MFKKIFIPNRGEIACRIFRTCQKMGIKSVVGYSAADADSLAVEQADEAILLGDAPAHQSYLDIEKVIEAAQSAEADALHPGFGFLSENPLLPERLKEVGINFIGPHARAISLMGDKIESRKLAQKAGLTMAAGSDDAVDDLSEGLRLAESIGWPVMIKAAAGGGGKGLRIAFDQKSFEEGFQTAVSEARSAFGDGRVFLEKYIERPRHIEIQILADHHGNVLHLNERECSVQRRHQKILEEAPSPFVDEALRQAMGQQACALARAVGYDSAGTVEFIVDQEGRFYFLEMNTRLQVEHPVTEMTLGFDLVEWMIRIAAGEHLTLQQEELSPKGWAIEARIYAEDSWRNFMPSTGRLVRYRAPGQNVCSKKTENTQTHTIRLDSGVQEGDRISLYYDPMMAKLIAHGATRGEAVKSLTKALEHYAIMGVETNIPFLSSVLEEPRFLKGEISTAYIDEVFPEGFQENMPQGQDKELFAFMAAYAKTWEVVRPRKQENFPSSPLNTENNFTKTPQIWDVAFGETNLRVHLCLESFGALCFAEPPSSLKEQAALAPVPLDHEELQKKGKRFETNWTPGDWLCEGMLNNAPFCITLKRHTDGYHMRRKSYRIDTRVLKPEARALLAYLPERHSKESYQHILSPMPGLVLSIAVRAGDVLKPGQNLLVIEAMKMENILRADHTGIIKEVLCAPGDQVGTDQPLLELEQED